MLPFALLLIALLAFRGLGALGVESLASWQDSARYAMALMLLFTASAHFTPMKDDLIKMVPRVFPYPRLLVYFTGVCELFGAVGLLIPWLSRIAGLCLVLLFIAMFPANINAARNAVPLRGAPPTALWLRLPIQLVFIGLTWWATQ